MENRHTIAIASALKSYYYSLEPFSVNGTSARSGGASYFKLEQDRPYTAANLFMAEDNIPFHNHLYMVPSIPILVAECFLQACEYFPPSRRFDMDLKDVIQAALNELKKAPLERFEKVRDGIKKIAMLNSLEEYASETLRQFRYKPYKGPVALVPGYNPIHRHFIIDCATLGVDNVSAAAILCRLLLCRNHIGLKLSLHHIIKTLSRLSKNVITRWLY